MSLINSIKTNCLTWPVAQTAPGVFTVDGTYAAAVNQDGSINSAANPAPLNSIVAIFATGLGPIDPPQADGSLVGLPLPVNTLPVYPQVLDPDCIAEGIFSGFCPTVPSSAVYAGPAPFLVAGASQVNLNASYATYYGFDLAVETPSGIVLSNFVWIYLASQ